MRVPVPSVDRAPSGAVLVSQRWMSVEFGREAMWIELLFIADHHRRRGLGHLMVEELIGYAKEHGVSGIDLDAYGMTAAASFLWRSLGFRRLGRERYSLRIGKEWLRIC
jgi:GNAT superfamily N-acetyltransferase